MNRTVVLSILAIVVLIAALSPFVVFAAPGIVGADQSYVVASSDTQSPASAGDVVLEDEGKVVLVLPYFGRVIQFVGSPMGWTLLVGVPTLLFILTEIWEFVRS